MGAFFDNLHILMNDKYDCERLKNELSNILKNRGFSLLPEGSEGDISVTIFEPDDKSWVSIASDVFIFDSEETIRSYTDPLSSAFSTDVIAVTCYDSDYLRFALLNPGDNTDGWINVGKSYDPLIRRTKLSPWKKLVNENLPMVKKINLGFDRAISLNFTATGDPKNIETLRVVGVPLGNPLEGQVSWYNSREYC